MANNIKAPHNPDARAAALRANILRRKAARDVLELDNAPADDLTTMTSETSHDPS